MSARVVSLPCWEAFDQQDEAYRQDVLGDGLPRVSLEAGVTGGWDHFTGTDGLRLGIDRFGASAPADVIAEQLGFTGDAVATAVAEWLASASA
jgi:transketolase